jgi:hypothetical protein
MKIAVPKTAPMILFHSKESIAAKLPKDAALKEGARDDQNRVVPAEIRGDITRRRPAVIAAKRRIKSKR